MLVVLVTGRVEKATQKTCNSFRTCLSSLPPIYLWGFAYLFVDIQMILYLILEYHLIHGTTPIYLLSLSYLSAWIYLICLFRAVCQGWFIAKVDFKQVFNHVMRGQSIVIWVWGWWLLPHLWRDRTLGQGLMWPEVRIRRAIDLWHGNTRCCRFHWLVWLFFSVTVVLENLVETPIPFRCLHFVL